MCIRDSYGSRAGNGVILITTKKGRAGKAQFAANVSYSASWLPETIKVWGGNIIRHYNMNAYRNTVKPYQSANGKWVIPVSYTHLTVSEEHLGRFKTHLKNVLKDYQKLFNIKYDITYSIQSPATDTVSLDSQGNLLRDSEMCIRDRNSTCPPRESIRSISG